MSTNVSLPLTRPNSLWYISAMAWRWALDRLHKMLMMDCSSVPNPFMAIRLKNLHFKAFRVFQLEFATYNCNSNERNNLQCLGVEQRIEQGDWMQSWKFLLNNKTCFWIEFLKYWLVYAFMVLSQRLGLCISQQLQHSFYIYSALLYKFVVVPLWLANCRVNTWVDVWPWVDVTQYTSHVGDSPKINHLTLQYL